MVLRAVYWVVQRRAKRKNWSVDCNMTGKWRGEGSGARFWINLQQRRISIDSQSVSTNVRTHLVVYQTPLLQKRVHTHNGTYVSCKIPPACSEGEVLAKLETIRVDDKVPIILIH